MEEIMEPTWVTVLSVIVPLLAFMIAFMVALRPFIRDTALSAIRDVEKKVEKVEGRLNGLETSLEPLRQLSLYSQKRGLDDILKGWTGEAHSSLPLEKANRRDYLTQQGRTWGLTDSEAAELKSLLEEDARDDLARGVIGFAAFALVLLGITAIIQGLSKK